MNLFWTIVLAIVVGWLLLGFLGSMTEQRNREAVAWSFDLSEQDYAPVAQT